MPLVPFLIGMFLSAAAFLAFAAMFRRRVTGELRRVLQQAWVLFDEAPVACHEIDLNGVIRRVNRAECRWVGAEASGILGRPVWDFVAPESREESRKAVGSKLNRERSLEPFEREFLRKDGGRVFAEIHESLLRDAAGRVIGIRSLLIDTTAKKNAEFRLADFARQLSDKNKELELALETAREAVQAKSRFLANMSHEIRTPMNGVLATAELLALSPLNREQEELVETIRSSANCLLGILNDILDLAKIEAGKLRLQADFFDLHDCVRSTAALFLQNAQKKGLRLDVSIAPGTPRTVRSDELRIRQVLGNLIENAVKFTEQGGIRMVVEPGPRLESTARVRFTVEDTGSGIPADQKDRLFTRFGQVDDSTTRRHGGAGLGLAISRQLVETLGGEIGFSSEAGAGSRFWFSLPLGLPVETAFPEELPVAGNQIPTLGCGLRVLVADDNRINRRVITRLLEQAGCAVDIAPNGQDAVRLVSAGRYDAVLMDIFMPDMDGYQATAAIRALPGDAALTPVIALSASVMPEDRKKCQEAGMDDYVAKPVSLKALIDALNRFARRPVQPPL